MPGKPPRSHRKPYHGRKGPPLPSPRAPTSASLLIAYLRRTHTASVACGPDLQASWWGTSPPSPDIWKPYRCPPAVRPHPQRRYTIRKTT
ncbi:hypothetical protein C8R44DRAFT_364390 [Mycena epipterygia]|nr:hypothetical protein C8R44DRAFT_364390 [Mycena epipterygia]